MKAPSATGIARVALEATRAYTLVTGRARPRGVLPALPRQHHDALVGVEAVLSGEVRSGEHLHKLWLATAAASVGCRLLGPDYAQLPLAERRRLLLFRAVVLAMVDGPCTGYCHDERCPVLDDHDCHLETCMSRFGVPPGIGPSLLATNLARWS